MIICFLFANATLIQFSFVHYFTKIGSGTDLFGPYRWTFLWLNQLTSETSNTMQTNLLISRRTTVLPPTVENKGKEQRKGEAEQAEATRGTHSVHRRTDQATQRERADRKPACQSAGQLERNEFAVRGANELRRFER